MPSEEVGVWDPLIRIFRCGLAVCFTVAYLTREEADGLHLITGYCVLVALHLVGVVHTGRVHRENLVRAMLTGRKRA